MNRDLYVVRLFDRWYWWDRVDGQLVLRHADWLGG